MILIICAATIGTCVVLGVIIYIFKKVYVYITEKKNAEKSDDEKEQSQTEVSVNPDAEKTYPDAEKTYPAYNEVELVNMKQQKKKEKKIMRLSVG